MPRENLFAPPQQACLRSGPHPLSFPLSSRYMDFPGQLSASTPWDTILLSLEDTFLPPVLEGLSHLCGSQCPPNVVVFLELITTLLSLIPEAKASLCLCFQHCTLPCRPWEGIDTQWGRDWVGQSQQGTPSTCDVAQGWSDFFPSCSVHYHFQIASP